MGQEQARIEAYLKELRDLSASVHTTGELSFHLALHRLLSGFAMRFSVKIVHEPAQRAYGRPDFIFLRHEMPIGYLEVEAYGSDLDQLSGYAKEQNERFCRNLDNFLLTNCLEFRLYREGALVAHAQLPRPPERGAIALAPSALDAFCQVLEAFLSAHPPQIADPKTLARYLARRTRQLADATYQLVKADKESDLRQLHRAFERVLLPDLDVADFADMYAQTIAYGMFAARCHAPHRSPFTRRDAGDLIPFTNPFLRRLFQQVGAHDLDPAIAWIADEIASLLAQADMEAILHDFGKRRGREDPVVHFYEDFLQAYDPELRELRGVYYTPEPVVGYIVRSVDELLRTRFGRAHGLAEPGTLLLDPACGTGGFLFAVVEHIYGHFQQKGQAGLWQAYLNEHLLSQLYGFELLVAPYTIAHLKLGLQLEQLGWKPHSGQRLSIYLTNTLEQAIKQTEVLLGEYISKEANEAVEIKREKPILVVLGNPPYSGHSANRSVVTTNGKKELTWIGQLIEDYKVINGQPLGEKNPKWLQDDYVKFIRFAEWRIDRTGQGIVAFITNHAYLDNPTFRGMRQHLMRTFDEIYLLNLHGNARKKERAPDGSPDENVFDIQQGVAIMLAVKLEQPSASGHAQVYYADLWGTRETKYRWLDDHRWETTPWQPLAPRPPLYLFVPETSHALAQEYEQGWRIPDIFPVHSVGIVTARDKLTIHFTPEAVWETVKTFASLDPETARQRFHLGKDVRDWKVALAQKDLQDAGVPHESAKARIVPLLYRPYDVRYTFYTGTSKGFHCRPRVEVMGHLLKGDNSALLCIRQQSTPDDWAHVGIAKTIVESCALSNRTKEIGYVFPLYLYEERSAQGGLYEEVARRANLNPDFLKALAALGVSPTPEAVLGYLYAVLHCPTYRARYAEFLRRDFPRVPLPPSPALFETLAGLGQTLIALHTLDMQGAPALNSPTVQFPKAGSNVVERVHHAGERVWINREQYFEPVPLAVWEFRVGGYQVAEKWLTERKGRPLGYADLMTYLRILSAIEQTLKIMEQIDAVWGHYFPT